MGSLRIFLASRYPESYHGFIGTGQMIAFAETERIDYATAMQIAEQKGDTALVAKLRANGAPPYYGSDVTWKSAVYLNYLNNAMARQPGIQNPGYNTLQISLLLSTACLTRSTSSGVLSTLSTMCISSSTKSICEPATPSLMSPCTFSWDVMISMHRPTVLVEEYEQLLEAPKKEIVWFEHSGHNPWINERDKFAREVIACFLES